MLGRKFLLYSRLDRVNKIAYERIFYDIPLTIFFTRWREGVLNPIRSVNQNETSFSFRPYTRTKISVCQVK